MLKIKIILSAIVAALLFLAGIFAGKTRNSRNIDDPDIDAITSDIDRTGEEIKQSVDRTRKRILADHKRIRKDVSSEADRAKNKLREATKRHKKGG